MKRNSIVFKLFIITVLLFTVFLGVFMAGQTLFFKSFYLNMKISRLEKSVEKFSLMYEEENWDSASISRNVNKFADQYNSQIAILDENGNAKYTPNYEFVLETPDKSRIKVLLNNIAYLEGFQNLKLDVGEEIEVEGFLNGQSDQITYLSSIKNGDEKWENTNISLIDSQEFTLENAKLTAVNTTQALQTAEETAGTVLQGGVPLEVSSGTVNFVPISATKIEGRIVELDIPSQIAQITNFSRELLWSSIGYWNGLLTLKKIEVEPDRIVNFHYTSSSNGMDNIVLVKPISKDGKISEYVFAVSSLQPVGEAVDVVRDYYLYAFLAALILIAVMALLFSRIVAKPLININQVAVKMAGLDFSEEVAVRSNDELGSLAVSLNRLSKNLGTSLGELQAANRQLQLDIEKEKQLETMRKEFVSSVSHELKTPLGIIKGFAEGVKDNIAENKKEHYISVILDEIEKMDELVLDLLDLAKLESKAYKLELESFHVFDLLDEVETRLINRICDKKLKLQPAYECRNYKVYGDRRRIEQVVTNILNNAIRHANCEGYIKIGAKDEGNTVLVYIENSGEHIAEEDLERIWERFYRAEKSRDRKTGGTGLGLSIVKNILEMHGSRFGVENTEDGVRFYFTLEKAANNVLKIAAF